MNKTGHLLAGDQRGRGESEHRKKVTEPGALTLWGPQRKGQVRNGIERKQPIQGHSLTGDHRGRVKSTYKKRATKPGALTAWRLQNKGQVRTQKETDQARGTYCLETTEGVESQDTERN